jgi:hypothetical protein
MDMCIFSRYELGPVIQLRRASRALDARLPCFPPSVVQGLLQLPLEVRRTTLPAGEGMAYKGCRVRQLIKLATIDLKN